MDTAEEIRNRIRPLIEQEFPTQLKQFDAFGLGVIDAKLNPTADETALGAVEYLSPEHITSYLLIIQAVMHIANEIRKMKKKKVQDSQADEKVEEKSRKELKGQFAEKTIDELIKISKQVADIWK
jgi:hypothetical protein